MHDANCFLTLTYDDRHCPLSLVRSDFQKFMKRLRKAVPCKVRYYHCGEYGDNTRRPHYHAVLFGYDFPDRKLFRTTGGHDLYISEQLLGLWPFGHHLIGSVDFESAAYVARYCLKKINGPPAEDHYTLMDPETGELVSIEPEYATMSSKPGIGRAWIDKFSSDVYPHDWFVIRGQKMRPPRYYDLQQDAELIEWVKDQRVLKAQAHEDFGDKDRLAVRNELAEYRQKRFVRETDL